VERTDTPFTSASFSGQVLRIPIAHMDGNYFCEPATLAELERNHQIMFRYVAPDGGDAAASDRESNPNGSLQAIAGICNRERNVLGLMPHPERAVESPLGSADGLVIFRSMVQSLAGPSAIDNARDSQKIQPAVRV
jgi:phosphoribosylformylglycinamidine (FGAM) synthase-like amidotransferase family enzyme